MKRSTNAQIDSAAKAVVDEERFKSLIRKLQKWHRTKEWPKDASGRLLGPLSIVDELRDEVCRVKWL